MPQTDHDEDIKIAPDDITKLFEEERQTPDDGIDLFIRQKSLGNIERARKAGTALAADLLDCVRGRPPEGIGGELFELQTKLLFAYAVNRAIEDRSPNSILSHVALSNFYEVLEEAEPALFESISGGAAFSLYLYLHRTGKENPRAVGETFAKLCEAQGNPVVIRAGEQAFPAFLSACEERIRKAGYRGE